MKVIIRGHPRERMLQRGVTDDDVMSVVDAYSYSVPSHNGASTSLFGTPNDDGRVLMVVLLGSPPRTPYIVKTVAWKDENDD